MGSLVGHGPESAPGIGFYSGIGWLRDRRTDARVGGTLMRIGSNCEVLMHQVQIVNREELHAVLQFVKDRFKEGAASG